MLIELVLRVLLAEVMLPVSQPNFLCW